MLRAAAAALAASQLLAPAAAVAPAAWSTDLHVTGVVDVSTARTDGRLVVSGGSRLWLLDRRTGDLAPFAADTGGYPGGAGDEPYLAVAPGRTAAGGGCAFTPDDVYVIQQGPRDVLRIDRSGLAHRFAHVDGVDSLGGIAFDTAGRFGGRLLVIGPHLGATVVAAIDCRGGVEHITDRAPVMEGGIAVAPPGFGAFGGDLVGADELSGQILAVRPDGSTAPVARSGLPAGGDVGVEGVGFVPAGFTAGGVAYFADRSTPGNPHPGTNTLLRLDAGTLAAAGVRDGDLLAATEGGARTIDVRCAASCSVTEVAAGPPAAHGEGHLVAVADHPAAAGRPLPEASDLGAAARLQTLVLRLAIAAAVAAAVGVTAGAAAWLRRRRRT